MLFCDGCDEKAPEIGGLFMLNRRVCPAKQVRPWHEQIVALGSDQDRDHFVIIPPGAASGGAGGGAV